jgi:hypothetical protein
VRSAAPRIMIQNQGCAHIRLGPFQIMIQGQIYVRPWFWIMIQVATHSLCNSLFYTYLSIASFTSFPDVKSHSDRTVNTTARSVIFFNFVPKIIQNSLFNIVLSLIHSEPHIHLILHEQTQRRDHRTVHWQFAEVLSVWDHLLQESRSQRQSP